MEWACEDLNLGPLPYQLTAGNRCAEARFRRSRPTVGAEVKCSPGVQLSALPMRLEPTDATPPLSPVLPYVLLRAAVYMYVSQRGDRCTPSRLRTKPDP